MLPTQKTFYAITLSGRTYLEALDKQWHTHTHTGVSRWLCNSHLHFRPHERKNADIISWLHTSSSVCTDTRRFWLHCNCLLLSRLAQQYT